MSRFSWMPMGGLGEVGMNCMLFTFGQHVIPVDAGVVFADPNDYGVDAAYPDFRKILNMNVKEWIITHGHEDHIGAVPAVFHLCKILEKEAPRFYAPPLAYALIIQKLSDSRYPGLAKYKENVQMVQPGDEITLGEVKIKFLENRHSTPESCALAFFAPGLKVLHTADLKLDYHEFEDGIISLKRYDVFDGQAPDFLFMDSTNAERSGQSISEADIREHLEEAIKTAEGRIFITLFSSNIYRIALLIHLAEKNNKKVCLAGRSMKQTFAAAKSLGIFKKSPSFLEETLIEPEESVNLDPKKVVILCSGSQGEFRSVLSKISSGSHPVFRANESDTILFSSKMIPGNERSILRLIDGLMNHNVKVLWGDRAEEEIGGPIHASGHGRSEELKELVRFLKPKTLIPVHGALHQLKASEKIAHDVASELATPIQTYIALNNSKLEFEKREDSWKCVEQHYEDIPQEKFLRFEYFDCPSRDPFLKARKFAADGGSISIAVDSIGKINVLMKGVLPENFVYSPSYAKEKLLEDLHVWMSTRLKTYEKEGALRSSQLEQVKTECEDDIARMVKKVTGSKPLVFVHFI